MALFNIKQWLGKRASLVTGGIFIIALVLYAIAYLIERGFTGLSFGTVIAAIATALLLASVSVTLEQYIKARLVDQEIATILTNRELGIQQISERDSLHGRFSGMPHEILSQCHSEIVILAYSAENFVERNQVWISESLDNNKYIGILLLDPAQLEHFNQIEGINLNDCINKTLGYCRKLISEKPKRSQYLKVKGFEGHFYFGGVFVDRYIVQPHNDTSRLGTVCIQLKANFKSQHEGIVLTFNSNSRYSNYYSDSCREIWERSKDLI